MDFKDLLTKQGFDPDKVMVLRHSPIEPALRKVLPWFAAEKPQVFNAYQREQNPAAEKALMKAEIAASFIAQDDEKALFVGLYHRKGWRPITNKQYWAIPENAEMKPFGLGGIRDRETAQWFDLELMDTYKEWKGRLVVKWPPGRLWWRWAKSNDFPIHAIHEESLLDAEMPAWERLSLTWEDLRVLPTKWKTILSQWRGIYFIFDVKLAKGYVGLSLWQREHPWTLAGLQGFRTWRKQEAQGAAAERFLIHDSPADFAGHGEWGNWFTGVKLERAPAHEDVRPERQLIVFASSFRDGTVRLAPVRHVLVIDFVIWSRAGCQFKNSLHTYSA